jgi:rhamnosyl/mannosyltransferase
MFMANFGSPIVYTHHAEICWVSERLSKIYRDFHRFLTGKARAIIVHSYDYARLFEKANVEVVRMPCPFGPSENLGVEGKKSPFTVLYVGQFRPFKGIDVFIKAAMILKDVNFFLVGDGYLKPKFMHMAEGLANVKFFGRVSDEQLIELYKQAHVVCLPSVNTTEAYGLVLIEGALYGCVPLATNLIGVRENISQLRGLLFEPKSHTSLVEKIRMLADDMGLWVNLAEGSQKAAVSYVGTYSPDYYVNRHEEIFKRCL